MTNVMKAFCALILAGCVQLSGGELIFGNRHADFKFDETCGFTLLEIKNKTTGRSINMREGNYREGIWNISMLKNNCSTSVTANWKKPSYKITKKSDGQNLIVNWKDVHLGGSSFIDVTVELFLPNDSALLTGSLNVDVRGNTAQWPMNISFPVIQNIHSLGDSMLIWPHHLGRVMKNPNENLKSQMHMRHPAPWSMQFIAYHGSEKLKDVSKVISKSAPSEANGYVRGTSADETGIYVDCLDAKNRYKVVYVRPEFGNKKLFRFWVSHYSELPDWPHSKFKEKTFSYSLPYPVRFGTFAGGYTKACDIYRKWSLQQTWAAAGPVRTLKGVNKHISEKMIDNVFWGGLYEWPAKMIPESAAFSNYFKVPSSTLWYRWNVAKFDMYNPDYWPVNPYLRRGFREMQLMNIPVTPYICGNIWSMDSDSWKKENAGSEVVREFDGTPKKWVINKRANAWMNPTSPIWRKKLTEVAAYLLGDWGSTGLYIDVLAAASHSSWDVGMKTIHGGSYWASGSREIIEAIRKEANKVRPDSLIISEGFSEAYIKDLDGFLTLDLTRGGYAEKNGTDIFPLFSFGYHDYAIAFGGDIVQFHPPKDNRWQICNGLAFGIQLMIFAPDICLPEKGYNCKINDRFLREVMQAWHQVGWKFLTGGKGIEMAQVPTKQLVGQAPFAMISPQYKSTIKLFFNNHIKWNGPAVPASAWRAFDNTVGIVLSNITAADTDAVLCFNQKAKDTTDSVLWRSWPLPVKKIGKVKDITELALKVKKNSIQIYELRNDTAPEVRPLLPDNRFFMARVKKDGSFPVLAKKTTRLWACEDSWVKNEIASDSNKAMLLDNKNNSFVPRRTPYKKYVSIYQNLPVPDKFSAKTHFLLKPSLFHLAGNATASIQCFDDALRGIISVKKTSTISGKADCRIVILKDNGKAEIYNNKVKLAPGEYRFAAWKNTEDVSVSSAKLLEDISKFSRQTAQKSKVYKISENTKNHQKRLRFIANSLVFVATGCSMKSKQEYDWALPFIPMTIDFDSKLQNGAKISKTELSVTLARLEKQTKITKLEPLAWRFEAVSNDLIETFVPLLFSSEIVCGKRRFTISKLLELDVNRPLMLEEHWKSPGIKQLAAGKTYVDKDVRVYNAYPQALDIDITPDFPKGLRLAEGKKSISFKLKPYEFKYPAIRIECDKNCKPGLYKLRYNVNYTKKAETAYSVDLDMYVMPEKFPVPSKFFIKGNTGIDKTLERRGNVSMFFQAKANKKIIFKLNALRPRSRTIGKWFISAFDSAVAASGKLVLPRNSSQAELSFTPVRDGIYHLHIDIPIFHGGIDKITMGWRLEVADNVSFCWDASPVNGFGIASRKKPVCYNFFVPAAASKLSFFCKGGWPSWPSSVEIISPTGRKAFSFKGAMREKVQNITVEKGESNGLWKLKLSAGEDMKISMYGDVLPYLIPIVKK